MTATADEPKDAGPPTPPASPSRAEAKAPEAKAPEAKAPEAKAPEPKAPEAKPVDPERRPPPYELSDEALERDTDIEFLKGSGPGGQHRNKRETGVRLRHRPSGVVVTATERRSQTMNRGVAFDRLREALEKRNAPPPKKRRPTRPSAGAKARARQAKTEHSERKAARRYRPPRED